PLGPGESAPPDSAFAVPVEQPGPALPADLDTPWDTFDLLILFIFSLGMLYMVTNLMAAFAVMRLGVPANQVERFATTNAGFVVCRQIAWFGVILLFLYAVVHRRTAAPFWRTMGWR